MKFIQSLVIVLVISQVLITQSLKVNHNNQNENNYFLQSNQKSITTKKNTISNEIQQQQNIKSKDDVVSTIVPKEWPQDKISNENKWLKPISGNLSGLIPEYRTYVGWKIAGEISGSVDYKTLELVPFDLNVKLRSCILPFSNKYKIGGGFDVENFYYRSSPFILKFLNANPNSIEGQDGKIKVQIAETAEQLADQIGGKIGAFGSGYGVKAAASFSASKESSLASDEVILTATHDIDLGAAQFNMNSFTLTPNARKLLATNKKLFNEVYGTHYISGVTRGCKLEIFMKKKASEGQKKSEIAIELKGSYDAVAFTAGGEVNFDKKDSETKKSSNTDISISYTGCNDNKIMSGLSMDQLTKAIIEFPEHCQGDINEFILMPYEKCQHYIDSKIDIDFEINRQNREIYNLILKDKKLKPEQQKIEDQKHMSQINIEQMKKAVQFQQDMTELEDQDAPRKLMNSVFIKAIILNSVIKNTYQQQSVDNYKEQKTIDDKIFSLQIQDDKIYQLSKQYVKKLDDLQDKKIAQQLELIKEKKVDNTDSNEQFELIKTARDEIYALQQRDMQALEDLKSKQEDITEAKSQATATKLAQETAKAAQIDKKKLVRYIKIRHANSKGSLQVSSLQAFDKGGIERAHGKTKEERKAKCTSSKSYSDSTRCENALEENISFARNWEQCYYAYAANSGDFFQVDLQGDYQITEVKYFGSNYRPYYAEGKQLQLINSEGTVLQEKILTKELDQKWKFLEDQMRNNQVDSENSSEHSNENSSENSNEEKPEEKGPEEKTEEKGTEEKTEKKTEKTEKKTEKNKKKQNQKKTEDKAEEKTEDKTEGKTEENAQEKTEFRAEEKPEEKTDKKEIMNEFKDQVEDKLEKEPKY